MMIHHVTSWILALAIFVFLGIGGVMASLDEYLDADSLTALATAEDLGQLDNVYERLPYHDSVMDVVYWSKRYALDPTSESSAGLLDTMPRSPLEFDYLYSVTYTEAYRTCPSLANIVAGYYGVLAKIVARDGKNWKAFLTLSRFSDGEAADDLSDWNSFLLGVNRARFVSTLRKLDDEGRRRVCGDCSILHGKEERTPSQGGGSKKSVEGG